MINRINSKQHTNATRVSRLMITLVTIISCLLSGGCGSAWTDITPVTAKNGSTTTANTITINESSFGMTINSPLSGEPWPSVPFGTWRLWDVGVTWLDLEPSRGVYQFNGLDSLVSLGLAQNTQMILTLGQTPRWAGETRTCGTDISSTGGNAPPASEQDWIDYVTTVAQRYKGRIRYYEVWNEPNASNYWCGSVTQLLQMQKDAFIAIHAIDSSARVISPSVVGEYGLPYLNQLLNGGMANYADVIGYHLYVTPAPPEQIATLTSEVQAALTTANVSGKELWTTETGWALPATFPDPTIAAAWLVRAHLIAYSHGVKRFIWYAWDNRNWVTLQLTDTQDNPTLAATAHVVLQQWLIGSQLTACTQDQNAVWSCPIIRSGKQGVIAWHAGGPAMLDLPKTWKASSVQDALGNLLSFSGESVTVSDLPQLISE